METLIWFVSSTSILCSWARFGFTIDSYFRFNEFTIAVQSLHLSQLKRSFVLGWCCETEIFLSLTNFFLEFRHCLLAIRLNHLNDCEKVIPIYCGAFVDEHHFGADRWYSLVSHSSLSWRAKRVLEWSFTQFRLRRRFFACVWVESMVNSFATALHHANCPLASHVELCLRLFSSSHFCQSVVGDQTRKKKNFQERMLAHEFCRVLNLKQKK